MEVKNERDEKGNERKTENKGPITSPRKGHRHLTRGDPLTETKSPLCTARNLLIKLTS